MLAKPSLKSAWEAGLSLSLKLGLVLFSFGQSLLLARWMAPEEFGKFSMILTLAILFGSGAALGQHAAVLRFVSEYEAKGSQDLARGVVRYAFRIAAFGCAAVALLFLAGAAGVARFDPSLGQVLFWSAPLLIVWGYSEILMSLLRGRGHVFWSTAPRDLVWRACTILIALSLASLGGPPSAARLAFYSALALALLCALQVFIGRDVFRAPATSVAREKPVWQAAALGLTLATFVSAAVAQADTPLIGLALRPEEAGQFFVVQRVATTLTVVGAAINIFYGARFSALYHTHAHAEIRALTHQVALFSLVTAIPAYAILVIWPEFVLSLFGETFRAQSFELRVLATAYFIDAVCGPVGVVLLITGHQNEHFKILVVAFVVRTVALLSGAFTFGLPGAASGAALGQALMIVMLWAAVRRHTGFDVSVLALVTEREKV